MSDFSVYFGTILTVNGENIRITDAVPVMGGDGYFTVIVTRDDGSREEMEPYNIFTLAMAAEKIIYPDGSVFDRAAVENDL